MRIIKKTYRDRRFLKILGTARRFAVVIGLRSTGQVGCRDNHSVMQARQNACSQTAAWKNKLLISGSVALYKKNNKKTIYYELQF